MKRIFILLLVIEEMRLSAQSEVFTEKELTSVILKFHPLAKQADINVDIAKSEILANRGGFDPQLIVETARKEFSGTTYYNHQVKEVNIPTWYGIDLVAGTEGITGGRINPEETYGSITYMGLSIQPLQNFLIDKRRAALLQAKNFHLLSKVERRVLINDLMLEALNAYWDWWEKYSIHEVVKSGLLTAERRFELVKTAYQLGDRPAVDTLEALTQLQSFEIKASEAYEKLVKAQLHLSAFLWVDNNAQYELPLNTVPQEYASAEVRNEVDLLDIARSHPVLRQYDYKIKSLQIDKRLAYQSLFPEVKLKYNQTGYNLSKTLNGTWFNNNYKFGVSFTLPMRLSEGRGEYAKAKLKIENTRLEQNNKQVMIFTKIKQYFAEWQQTEKRLSIQAGFLTNTRGLQKAEQIKYDNGESSLFLINARQQQIIEAEQKVIELKAKMKKIDIGIKWSAGLLAF